MQLLKTSTAKALQNIRSAKSIASPPRILIVSLQVMYSESFYLIKLKEGLLFFFLHVQELIFLYLKNQLSNLIFKIL